MAGASPYARSSPPDSRTLHRHAQRTARPHRSFGGHAYMPRSFPQKCWTHLALACARACCSSIVSRGRPREHAVGGRITGSSWRGLGRHRNGTLEPSMFRDPLLYRGVMLFQNNTPLARSALDSYNIATARTHCRRAHCLALVMCTRVPRDHAIVIVQRVFAPLRLPLPLLRACPAVLDVLSCRRTPHRAF
jgi:hypothetical protein